MSKPRSQRIRATPSTFRGGEVAVFLGGREAKRGTLQIGGWLSGRHSYMWFGVGDKTDSAGIGILEKRSLYRLAKAIVRHWEADK